MSSRLKLIFFLSLLMGLFVNCDGGFKSVENSTSQASEDAGPSTPAPTPTPSPGGNVQAALKAEYVDAAGQRRNVSVVSGQTVISGVAPFLVQFDASDTRAPSAFAAQTAIQDAEAYAFLMVGYRMQYGENEAGVWRYPEGANHPRSADSGPPLFSRIYLNPGSFVARLKARDVLGNESIVSMGPSAIT